MNSKILEQVLEHRFVRTIHTSENLAEVTSLCSDTSERIYQLWHTQLNKPSQCLAMLLILPLIPKISRNGFWKMKIIDHMAQQCYKATYQGDWIIVQEILERRNQSLHSVLSKILEHKDTFFLFGNLLPLADRMVNGIKAREAYVSVIWDERPVRKIQRKRGYNDKGTLPDPQKLGIEYYRTISSNPREDRRTHIAELRSHEWFNNRRKRYN